MFGRYFGRFLLKRSAVTAENIAEIADLPYHEFTEALARNGNLSQREVLTWLEEFKTAYRLKDEDLSLFDSGNIDDIIPFFADISVVTHEGDSVIRFLRAYQADKHLSDKEVVERLNLDSLETILPTYLLRDPATYKLFIRKSLQVMSEHYLPNPTFDNLTATHILDADFFVCQEMKGTHNYLFGIIGQHNALLDVAEQYAGRRFSKLSSLAIDTLCEIVNTVTGIFVSEVNSMTINIELQPPLKFTNKVVCSNNYIYCLPVEIESGSVSLIYCFDGNIRFLDSEKGGNVHA